MIIPFLDWQPDAVDFGASGSSQIINAVPAERSFQPFPSLNVFTDALTARPRGTIQALDKDGASHTYVGDETKLYELDTSDLTFTDVTRSTGGAYATGSGEVWNFVRWKNKVLATNFTDDPQQITMGGTNYSALTTAFKARNVTVIGDFVVFSNTYDTTDGNVPNRVRWSAQDDETDYTVSATTLSDYRDIPTGGPIRKIVGGEVGIIVSEKSVFRMSFVGAPAVFQIDEILPDYGTIAGGSVTKLGDSVYLISDQGFIEITGNGTGVNPIGAGRVDKWFRSEFDTAHKERVFALADPTNNRILWAFPGSANNGGRPNKIIIYDKTFNKWALVEEEVEIILRSKGFEVTLENLETLGYTDIDAMTVSLDSFKSLPQLGAIDENNKMGFFWGGSKTATLETGEIEITPGRKTNLNAFKPLVVGGTITAEVGQRSKLTDSVSWSDSLSLSSSGRFTKRANDNFHRFRLTVSGDWEDAIGIQLDRSSATGGAGRG